MKEQKEAALAEEIKDIRKWVKPKTKVRKVYKIEEDGSKTKAHVIERSGIAKFHSEDGPALVNGKQKRKEYYLNGIEYTFDNWNEIMKSKEGLPWYKTSMGTGTSRH